jgi:hypothetical protein
VSDPRTTADLLAASLRALGVRRAFRAPGCELPALEGIDELAVSSQAIAVALCDADGRLAQEPEPRPGVALLPGNCVRISTSPGAIPDAITVDQPADLVMAVAGWALGSVAGCTDLIVSADRLTRLSPSLADFRTVLLLGPGVARAGQSAGAMEAARATGAGIVLTPSAVDVLPADHPFMRGVVGLQARDAELTGFADAELVIAAGLDPSEALPVGDAAQVLEVEPWHLPLMASHWEASDDPSTSTIWPPSSMRHGLATFMDTTTGIRSSAPWKVLDVLTSHLPPGAVVAAEPGIAALWLARALPFATLAADPSAAARRVVPTRPAKGFAAAAAFVAALDGRPAVALFDDVAPHEATTSILQMAEALDLPVIALTWTGDADTGSDVDDLPVLLRGGRGSGRVTVDLEQTEALLDYAGPVTAWLGDT